MKRSFIRLSLLVLAALVAISVPGRPAASAGPIEGLDLDESVIARYERVLSWLFSFEVTESTRPPFAQAIRADWQGSTTKERADFGAGLQAMEAAMAWPDPRKREVVRLKMQEDALKQASAKIKEPLPGFLWRMYAGAHPPVATGSPELTREVAEGFFGLLGFILADLRGVAEPIIPREDVDKATEKLAQRWPRMSVAQRQNIVGAPLQLAALRFRWPSLPAAEKEQTRGEWRRQLERSNLASQAAAPREAPVSKPGPTPAQVAQTNQIIANAQRQIHDMNMQIIANIGAISSGWEYRWVPRN